MSGPYCAEPADHARARCFLRFWALSGVIKNLWNYHRYVAVSSKLCSLRRLFRKTAQKTFSPKDDQCSQPRNLSLTERVTLFALHRRRRVDKQVQVRVNHGRHWSLYKSFTPHGREYQLRRVSAFDRCSELLSSASRWSEVSDVPVTE